MGKFALSFLVVATLVARAALAADDPFVGEWKLDQARSRLTDQMKVESIGPNRYAFDFGGGAEPITIDGTDQPGYAGTTLAVTVKGPDSWNVVRKQGGKRMLSADWQLSSDGKSLTDRFTSFGADGKGAEVDYVYARTAGTSGFAGTWESTDVTFDQAFVITVRPYGADGLSFVYSTGKTKDMRFDGKDYQPTGPGAIQGSSFSARRVSGTGLEVTDKLKGAAVDTQEFTLSADGKTMTLKIHAAVKRLPDTLVFERQ